MQKIYLQRFDEENRRRQQEAQEHRKNEMRLAMDDANRQRELKDAKRRDEHK